MRMLGRQARERYCEHPSLLLLGIIVLCTAPSVAVETWEEKGWNNLTLMLTSREEVKSSAWVPAAWSEHQSNLLLRERVLQHLVPRR